METIPQEMIGILEEIRRQLASLSERVAKLEGPAAARVAAAPKAAPESAPAPVAEEISEDEILAISAALAAFLGVHPHIRQIRLISSHAWAEEGRVTVQASHRLHA